LLDSSTGLGRELRFLLRYQDQTGEDRADIIDMLTMHPEARRRVVRVLGEIDAQPT
jgi:hypothetical protein